MSEIAAGDWEDTPDATSELTKLDAAVDPDETLRPGPAGGAEQPAGPATPPTEPIAAIDNGDRGSHQIATASPSESPITDNAGTPADDAVGVADPVADAPEPVAPLLSLTKAEKPRTPAPEAAAGLDPAADAALGEPAAGAQPTDPAESVQAGLDADNPGRGARQGLEAEADPEATLVTPSTEAPATPNPGDSNASETDGDPQATVVAPPTEAQLDPEATVVASPAEAQANSGDLNVSETDETAGALPVGQPAIAPVDAVAVTDDDGQPDDAHTDEQPADEQDADIESDAITRLPLDDSSQINELDRAAAVGSAGGGTTFPRVGSYPHRDARKWIHVVRHGYLLRSRSGMTIAAAAVLIVLTLFGLTGLLVFGDGATPETNGQAVLFVNSEAPATLEFRSLPPISEPPTTAPPPTHPGLTAVQAQSVGRADGRPRSSSVAAAPPVNRQPQPTSQVAGAPTTATSQASSKPPIVATSDPGSDCWTNFPAIATLLKRMGGC